MKMASAPRTLSTTAALLASAWVSTGTLKASFAPSHLK
jgi:hypothetical protein